jgi:outer membrane protein OmpA-like peptidoglycan-associated protein
MRLSAARARAVVEYLAAQWEFPRERFKIVGNGPDRPLCNERIRRRRACRWKTARR